MTWDQVASHLNASGVIYIPPGELHRMANPDKMPMVLIEVQMFTYLGEEDIVRYDDLYERW